MNTDTTAMKYLFFTNTPAQVHLYKHAVSDLRGRGHDVLVLGRDYGCTKELLEYHDLPYELYGVCGTTKYSLFRELPKHYANIFRRAWRYDPDLIFGRSAYAAHAGALTGTPTIIITDSETTGFDHTISRPFVNTYLTPEAFQKDLGANHYRFNGFTECAYLHPDIYTEHGDVRDQLGLGVDEDYVIVRFNAFGSHHDVGVSGFSVNQRYQLVERLSEHATVLVSDEGDEMDLHDTAAQPFSLHPARMHDALANANLLVADTQTMVTEAALLATPAIRSNSFVGEESMGNFLELEERDLIYNLGEFDDVLAKSVELLADDSIQEQWVHKRDRYMADKVNLADLIVDIAVNFDGRARQVTLPDRSVSNA